MDIKEVVKNIITKRCNVSNISEDDDLSKLGLDSLDLVEAMLEIEDAFSIEFANDEIANLKTIKEVFKLIEEKTK